MDCCSIMVSFNELGCETIRINLCFNENNDGSFSGIQLGEQLIILI